MSSFSSSSPQTFQEHPLVNDSQNNVLHFINPHSHPLHNDYYLTSPYNKQKEQQQVPRRFSYAGMLTGQEAPTAYDDPYYMPISTSSPSNDSRYSYSSSSDASTSPTSNEQNSFAETAARSIPLNETHHHLSASDRQPASLSYSMGGSQVPSHLEQPHRHSIAGPSLHLGPTSFYDTQQRPHRSSQPSLYDSSRIHQQQKPYFTPSDDFGLMRGFVGPAKSPHHKDPIDPCFSAPTMYNLPTYPSGTLESSPGKPTNLLVHDNNKDTGKKAPRSRGRRVSNIPSTGSQMFICKADACGKVFKRSEHLKRHIRSIHTLEKPFECPYQSCNKRFSRSDNLNQHIRIHRHNNNGKLDKQQQKQKQKQATPSSLLHNQQHQSSDNQHFTTYVQGFL